MANPRNPIFKNNPLLTISPEELANLGRKRNTQGASPSAYWQDAGVDEDKGLGGVFESAAIERNDPVEAALREEGITLDNDNPFVNRDVLSNELGGIFDRVSPRSSAQPLSEEQESRLSSLTDRASRLGEISPTNEPVSKAIQGNPFSITIGPGLQNLAIAAINQERQRRVGGDKKTASRENERLVELGGELEQLKEAQSLTTDPREQRGLQRKIDRVEKGMRIAQRRADRYSGFKEELQELSKSKTDYDEAQKRDLERANRREEFILDNIKTSVKSDLDLSKELKTQQKKHSDKLKEQQELYREKTTLQKDLFDKRTELERQKQLIEAGANKAANREEYASVVNSYVKTALKATESIDKEIDFTRRLILDFDLRPARYYYVEGDKGIPKDTPKELIAPKGTSRATSTEIGDPKYLELISNIKSLEDDKKEHIADALQIYENSTVLSPGTRILKSPDEEGKKSIQKLVDAGLDEEDLRILVNGMGYRYSADDYSKGESVAGTGIETNEPVDIQGSIANDPALSAVIGEYTERLGITAEEVVKRTMEAKGFATEKEALDFIKKQKQ